jgi:hypothetical protein
MPEISTCRTRLADVEATADETDLYPLAADSDVQNHQQNVTSEFANIMHDIAMIY